MAEVVRAVVALDAASDANREALAKKESQWDGILGSAEYRHQKFVADAWCSAFVWPKKPGPLAEAAPTNDLWRQLRDRQVKPSALSAQNVEDLAARHHFFHWHLAFPQVFARGGFDVVLGNPPWERVKLQEQEFFASRSDEIAGAPNAAARKKLIASLPAVDPALWNDWCAASRRAQGESHLVRDSGRYPLCGKGDVNTYALFAEHNRAALGPRGRAGFIVPTGIATDDTTKDYFAAIAGGGQLAALYDFENRSGLFPAVDSRYRLSLLTLTADARNAPADLVFYARDVNDLRDPGRHFSLSPTDFAVLNPNTRTCPTFRSRRDADINLAMYRRAGILWREDDEKDGNPWGLRFLRMFDMSSDSGLFKVRAELESAGHRLLQNRFVGTSADYLPLIEAKMVHHFDHRYGDYADRPAESENTSLPDVPLDRLLDPAYAPLPRYWVPAAEVDARLADRWQRGWLLGWRDICRSTDVRTVIASLIPRVAVGHTTPLVMAMLPARRLVVRTSRTTT
jgi:hypothetical protein